MPPHPRILVETYAAQCRELSGGWISSKPACFASRRFLGVRRDKSQRWEILDADQLEDDERFLALDPWSLNERIELMAAVLSRTSCPSHPPVCDVLFQNSNGVYLSWTFASLYEAQRVVQLLLNERRHWWIDEETIEVAGGIDVQSSALQDIMEAEEEDSAPDLDPRHAHGVAKLLRTHTPKLKPMRKPK